MFTQSAAVGQVTALLLNARNADGGWGYYAGKSSRLEPTCWALLALRQSDTKVDPEVLRQWPSRDGMLLERVSGEPNYAFHALGMMALSALHADHVASNLQLVRAIQSVKGVRLNQSPNFRQDNSLQAWSWVADTFSWVEPSAWCLLALKRYRRALPGSVDASRIEEAERLLLNRVCDGGGWNYGNPAVLGQSLRSHVPPTALALLALQDRRDQPAVQQSLQFLESHATSEVSASTLALTMIALRVYGRRTDSLDAAMAKQLPTSLSLGNLMGLSQALFALSMSTTDDHTVFAI